MNTIPCKIPGCPDPRRTKGWCNRHYLKARNHDGNPLGGRDLTPRGLALTYLWSHIDDITEQCMIWPYGTNGLGYGQIWLDGSLQQVHVLASERHHGARPPGMLALHAPVVCHNQLCFNWQHLSWGTPKQNSDDKVLDGTLPTGAQHWKARLTWNDVAAIRTRYALGGILQRELAVEYGISRRAVSDVVSRRNWKTA